MVSREKEKEKKYINFIIYKTRVNQLFLINILIVKIY